ncbi:hypothetical protein DFH06DRAFT_1132192 [Mycena polygramma]|nr:hypothetical protein DFH06DRAFT_1132192 [Mycena polygramma]
MTAGLLLPRPGPLTDVMEPLVKIPNLNRRKCMVRISFLNTRLVCIELELVFLERMGQNAYAGDFLAIRFLRKVWFGRLRIRSIENKWEMGLPAIVNGINNGITNGISTGDCGMLGISRLPKQAGQPPWLASLGGLQPPGTHKRRCEYSSNVLARALLPCCECIGCKSVGQLANKAPEWAVLSDYLGVLSASHP